MRTFCFTGFLFVLCIHAPAQGRIVQLHAGELNDSVYCASNPSQSYALYIPSTYNGYKPFPIIYFFEPGARGHLPVSLYAPIAESYSYILVCSNNSKNGPVAAMEGAAAAVLVDTRQRLKIDTTHILVCGFSGGSRFASHLAMQKPFIHGVIACGAGFLPEEIPAASNHFLYCAIVGNQDMNFIEIIRNHQLLEKLHYPNRVLFFDGGHEWPVPEKIKDALGWMKLAEIKQDSSPGSARTRATYFKQGCDSLVDMLNRKAYFEANSEAEFLSSTWSDKENTIDSLLRYYNKETEVRKQVDAIAGILDEEETRMDTLLVAFENIEHTEYNYWNDLKTPGWWEAELRDFRKMASSSNPVKANHGKRLISFVQINSYEYGLQTMDSKDYERAIKFYTIYTLFTPESPTGLFMLAKAYAYKGNHKLCMKNLEISIHSGFKRKDLLKKEPFLNFLSEAELSKLME